MFPICHSKNAKSYIELPLEVASLRYLKRYQETIRSIFEYSKHCKRFIENLLAEKCGCLGENKDHLVPQIHY